MELVLASASPRRKSLLSAAGYAFRVAPVTVDETPPLAVPPEEAARAIAERKARAANAGAGEAVLAADTVVVIGGEILGKPAGVDDARRMVRLLSGRTHEVWTAVAVLRGDTGELRSRVVGSRVRFRPLREEEIEAYAEGGEGLDKAGGYGIQGAAGAFVEEVAGPVDNVVGLPMETVREMLAGVPLWAPAGGGPCRIG